jgi:hypothetical protein
LVVAGYFLGVNLRGIAAHRLVEARKTSPSIRPAKRIVLAAPVSFVGGAPNRRMLITHFVREVNIY